MGMFNSYVANYQRVYPIIIPLLTTINHYSIAILTKPFMETPISLPCFLATRTLNHRDELDEGLLHALSPGRATEAAVRGPWVFYAAKMIGSD